MKYFAAIATLFLILGNSSIPMAWAKPSACPNEASARKAFNAAHDSFTALGLGHSLACHNRLGEAIALYRQIIQKDPAFAAGFDVYTDLGHALRKQGKVKEAITAYQTAIQHHAEPQSGAYEALSEILKQQGRAKEAEAVLRKRPILDPEGSI
jgi:tetratricopeptide (TPR) repeat protein